MPFYLWSTTSSSNGTSDPTINMQEGMPPAQVNDGVRAAMARLREWANDISGALTTGGTATAYTLTTNEVYDTAAHLNGQMLTVFFNLQSGAAPTLAVDSVAAAPLRLQSGVVPPTGAFLTGVPYTFTYLSATSEFVCRGSPPPAASITGAQLANGTVTGTQMAANVKQATIGIIIDGGGSVITTGQKGFVEVPFACTVLRSTLLADQAGSAVLDIWKVPYGSFPPTSGNSITASDRPTLSAQQNSQDSTLTGWTTSFAAGDILAYNVVSAATVTRLTSSLLVSKS